jgi:hypothetical protein
LLSELPGARQRNLKPAVLFPFFRAITYNFLRLTI